jgi:hypothetical protein
MVRQSKYTLLIICEGKNTEPYLFNSIRDRILEGKYLTNENIEVHIRPEVEEVDDVESKNVEYRPKRNPRTLLPGNRPIEKDIPGVPPLKWVIAAQEELSDGTFNEVWVVFDNDDHPARKEAFQKAQEIIGGKQVRIAYSSIAFEYYLLLHFEREYHAFQKSECRKGKVQVNCSTDDNHADDCLGEKCVGGYARRQGYWKETKGKISLFPMIENKLETGFRNAAWLRHQSNIQAGNIPFYDRNPYVTTDAIIKRLTGYQDQYFEFIPFDKDFDVQGNLLICFRKDLTVEIINTGKNTLIVPAGSITKTLFENGAQQQIGSSAIIKPGERINMVFAVSDKDIQTAEFCFNYHNYHLILSI